MGYLLFTARKLDLNSRVNSLNAKLAQISNKRFQLTQQISAKQQSANMQSAAASLSSAQAYSKELQTLKDTAAQNGTEVDYGSIMQAQAKKDLLNAESVFDQNSDTELLQLQQQDSMLDTEQKTIETQLSAAQKELEAVEKAEDSAIKNATPKYCA